MEIFMSLLHIRTIFIICFLCLVDSQRDRPFYPSRPGYSGGNDPPYYPPPQQNGSNVCKKYKFQCFLEPSFDPKITGQNLGFLRCEVSDTSDGAEHDVSRWTQCSICCNAWGLSRGRNDGDVSSYVYTDIDNDDYLCICCERKCKDKDKRRSSSEE
uniref:Uncharacterized protein n=1 Tax=Acrobeloides nanus TaxID=290746 RepID=A0A914C3I1_9BILA